MTTRQAFETEARKHGFILDRLDKSGVYVQLITEQAWSIWQAATATALERAAEVCVSLRDETVMSKYASIGNCTAARDSAQRCYEAICALKERP